MKFSITAICALCNATFEARTSYGLCEMCFSRDRAREFDRWQSACLQAEKHGLQATLTYVDWLHILSDHASLCAYCLTVPFSQIHMVNRGKGLTWENTVPICRACSVHAQYSWQAAVERVHVYLESDQLRDEEEEGEECDVTECPPTEYITGEQFLAEMFAVEPWRLRKIPPFEGGSPA